VFDVVALGAEDLRLVLPSGEAATLAARLKRHVLRAKLVIEDETESVEAVGVTDPPAIHALKTHLGVADRGAGHVTRAGELTTVDLPHARGLLVFGPHGSIDELSPVLGARVPPAHWVLAAIAAGVPEIVEATRELFIPQMLNLDLLDAVSFEKGCYVGQEIIARTQHLGRIKRRMLRARVAGGEVAAGMPVHARGEVTGHVVRAARDGAGGTELLATIGIADLGEILETGAPRMTLERLPLPYPVPELETPTA
jgi:folate-binding protein YgfZ